MNEPLAGAGVFVYHARARPRASEYGIGMTDPVIHLIQATPTPERSVCGSIAPIRWTSDAQAVTCERCIAKMELQPA